MISQNIIKINLTHVPILTVLYFGSIIAGDKKNEDEINMPKKLEYEQPHKSPDKLPEKTQPKDVVPKNAKINKTIESSPEKDEALPVQKVKSPPFFEIPKGFMEISKENASVPVFEHSVSLEKKADTKTQEENEKAKARQQEEASVESLKKTATKTGLDKLTENEAAIKQLLAKRKLTPEEKKELPLKMAQHINDFAHAFDTTRKKSQQDKLVISSKPILRKGYNAFVKAQEAKIKAADNGISKTLTNLANTPHTNLTLYTKAREKLGQQLENYTAIKENLENNLETVKAVMEKYDIKAEKKPLLERIKEKTQKIDFQESILSHW